MATYHICTKIRHYHAPPRTLPGPQPGSETNVEGGGSSRAVTRLHTMIGLTGYRIRDLLCIRRALYRRTEKHRWHMWPHTTYLPNCDTCPSWLSTTMPSCAWFHGYQSHHMCTWGWCRRTGERSPLPRGRCRSSADGGGRLPRVAFRNRQ
jgi:hypothetical protein